MTTPIVATRSPGAAVVAATAPALRSRELWVDTMRVVVIAAVIIVHAATAYVVPIDWYYQERTTSELWSSLLLVPVALAPELKFVIVAPVAVLAIFPIGYAITRVPGISRVL